MTSRSTKGLFDRDIELTNAGENRRQGILSPNWSIGGVPNGGFQLAVAAKALGSLLPHPDPLTITGHYLDKSIEGPVNYLVDLARAGSTMSTGTVRVVQQGSERPRVTGTFTDHGRAAGPEYIDREPPDIEPVEACLSMAEAMRGPFSIHDHLDLRLSPRCTNWLKGEVGDKAEFLAWMRFADDQPADLFSLLLFADATPPPLFNVLGASGRAPTLELTVHLRQRPAPGYLRGRFWTNFLFNGFFEENGELWDADDRLVAVSRQMGRMGDRGARR